MSIRAMILAAGRGERMRPLTDERPKPLLEVQGKPLMQWPMEALAAGGFTQLVVNTDWLGEQIASRFGPRHAACDIVYSHEGRDFGGALETAGGIVRALPLLDEVFWIVAGDVYMPEFRFARAAFERFAAGGKLAHLFLVPNPEHNPKGDFGLDPQGLATREGERLFTYSTVALLRRGLLQGLPAGNPQGLKAALAPLLFAAAAQGQVSAEAYSGPWTDVGTPQRLDSLNRDPVL